MRLEGPAAAGKGRDLLSAAWRRFIPAQSSVALRGTCYQGIRIRGDIQTRGNIEAKMSTTTSFQPFRTVTLLRRPRGYYLKHPHVMKRMKPDCFLGSP